MSWDFWGKQYKSSSSTTRDFAATAPADPTESIVPADPTTGDFDPRSGGTIAGISPIKCFDSQDCASGWSCIGGRCKPPSGAAQSSSNTGSGTTAGCGSGVGDTGGGESSSGAPGGGGGGCGAGTGGGGGSAGSGCTKTGPGSPSGGGGCGGGPGGGGADDCCGGERCCRNGTDCVCGPCPPPSGCNQYCAAEKSATGDSGAGCTEGEECSECEECRLGGFAEPGGELYKCRPKQGGPCNCPGNECGRCKSCNENGTCTQDDSRCMTCCNCFADCTCGKSVERRICVEYQGEGSSYSGLGCSSICRLGLENSCSDACGGGGGGSGGGSITGNVEPCDCNCNNDCGDCEICNAQGKCVPDPACGDDEAVSIWSRPDLEYPGPSGCPSSKCKDRGPCSCEGTSIRRGQTLRSACGKKPHRMVEIQPMTDGCRLPSYYPCSPLYGGQCGYRSVTSSAEWGNPGKFQIHDADGKNITPSGIAVFNGEIPPGQSCGCTECFTRIPPQYTLVSYEDC